MFKDLSFVIILKTDRKGFWSVFVNTMFDPRQISLETERLGPRRVEGLKKEDEEWQKKAHAAVLSIQDLTVKFFEATTRAQKGKCGAAAYMGKYGAYTV